MSQEILKPTSWMQTGWTGFISNIDETWPAGDGSTICTTAEGAIAVLNFNDVVDIKDYDTVNNVFLAFRVKSTWVSEIARPNPSLLFKLIIGGIRQSYARVTITQNSNYITGQATGIPGQMTREWAEQQ